MPSSPPRSPLAAEARAGPASARGSAAPYAVGAHNSRGRRHAEAPPAWRSEFQRDRDRVVHCSAFRRLEYKTQVFVNHEGDMFRTRLTHSLEVAQIARAVARALGVNEDLTEAIALAHDLGHTPFGHAGQAALNRCMKPFGGFEHNLHSLRVVERLERRYPDFDGLNLLYETREGLLKHCPAALAAELGELGERLMAGERPSIEAQVADLADEIAYNHHDIDDGLRSGILTEETVCQHALFGDVFEDSMRRHPGLVGKRRIHTAIRSMLGAFANDLIETSAARIRAAGVASLEEVRRFDGELVDFSPAVRAEHLSLKRLLHGALYNHPHVRRFTEAAAGTVTELFEHFRANPATLPAPPAPAAGDAELARAVADYIAGMTDRFAISAHQRLVGTQLWPERRRADRRA
ncbi:MAG: deoxyguanosinetriphosphate triphosphohydrolase [Gammaproteobacteria bacterium]